MANEFKVAVKLHADASQYHAEFTKAGQTAQAFSAQVTGSSGLAATGVQSVVSQLQSVGPAVSATAPAVQSMGSSLAGVGDKATKAGSSATNAFEKTTLSAKQTAAAMRGVPAQFTDIITSIQGGQAPLTVLLQQGGQLKDMFGGAGNAAKALSSYVLGLINPFTVAAAAAAGLGYAHYAGAQEAKAYGAALIMSGNAAGTSASQMADMAKRISTISGTQGNAAAALAEFASSGAVGAAELEKFALSAIKFEKTTGTAISSTVDKFEELKKSPLQASLKLNESMNYLTASIYSQIKALTEQGKMTEAADVAQKAFADTLSSRSGDMVKQLGWVEKSWINIKDAIAGAGDSIKSIGREDTTGEELTRVRNMIANKSAGMPALQGTKAGVIMDGEIEALRVQESILQSTNRELSKATALQAANAELVKASAKFDQDGLQYLSRAKKELQEIARVREQGLDLASREADVYKRAAIEAETDKRVALIHQSYDTGGSLAAVKQSEQAKLQEIARAQDQINTLRATGQATEIGQITQTTDLALKSIAIRRNALLAERAIVAARQDSEKEVIALNTQIAALDQEQVTARVKGANAVTIAWYNQKQAIEKTREAMRQEDQAALTAEMLKNEAAINAVNAAFLEQDYALAGLNRATALESRLLGESAEARNLALEKLKIQIDLEKQLRDLHDKPFSSNDEREAAYAKARSQADAASALAENRAGLEQQKAIIESIEGVAHSVFTNVAKDGKNAFETIGATAKSAVLDLLYQLTVKKWIISISASITGSMGVGAAAMAGEGGSGVNALTSLSAAQTLKGMYDAATAGLNFAGQAGVQLAGLAGKYGSQTLAGFAGGLTSTLSMESAKAAAQAGGAQLAGVIAGSVMNGVSGYGISKALSGGYSIDGFNINAIAGIASMIPGIGPIAGVIGGLVNRAFGHGETQVREQGTRGTFSGSGFSGSNYANMHQDGGWFTSDRDWTQTSAIDGGTLKAWSDAFVGVKSAVASTAASLGLSTDLINSYSKSIDLAAGSSKETIADMFIGMADEMALKVAPGLEKMIKEGETASVTLSRLSITLSTANTWLDMLGDKLMTVSLAGAEASSKLADMFGGLDKFTAASKTFYELFYSETERSNQSVVDMSKALALFNITLPTSKEAFKDLTKTLDLTTDYGREAYAVLLTIAPEYAATADTIAKLAKESGDKLLKLFTVAGNVDFAKVGQSLATASTETFVATLNQVFVDLAGRIKTMMDGIASERTAISNAAAQISGPKSITYAGLQGEIAAIKAKSGLPSDAGVIAANLALVKANSAATSAQKLVTDTSAGLSTAQTAKTDMAAYYQGKASELQRMASSYGLTANATGYNNDAYNYNAATNKLNPWNSIGYTNTTTTSSSLLFGSSSSTSSTLANKPAFLKAADSLINTLVGGNAALAKAASAIAPAQAKLTAAIAALPAAQSAQTAAAAVAKKAALDYAASIQAYVVEASKSVPALTKLREETVAYYGAQKELANQMATSAANLRSAVANTRTGQLDSAQSLLQRQKDFATSYSLALSTSGAIQAGYAGKLATALPELSTALKDSVRSQAEWELATGKLFAQSESVARLLDANAPASYESESLGLLASIDSTLVALDDSTSAITRAIGDGSALTAAGLRGIITQLGGVPAFASGGYHAGGIRLVGENGPELEVTGPSRIFNASQLRAMGSGGGQGSESTNAEIRQLREENQAQARALVELTARLAKTNDQLLKIFDSWDVEGMPQARVAA